MNEPTVVRFEARGAVRELFTSSDGAVLLSGAAGTGKSVGALMYVHLACLNVPGTRVLLARKTQRSLSATTVNSYKERVAKEALAAGLVSFFGGNAEEPASYRYVNGSRIILAGLDDPTKVMSLEIDLALLDEATELTPDDVEFVSTRLRNNVYPLQRMVMCANPSYPRHHLKVGADQGRYRILYSKHEDNPALYDGEDWTRYGRTYLDRLDKLTGVRYERLRWGKWVAADGLVYEGFNEAVHLIDQFDVPAEWRRIVTIDWGYTNPAVMGLWAIDGDGRLYLVREIVRTQTLVEDLARIARQDLLAGHPEPEAWIADHDAEDRATFEAHAGVTTEPARKAVNPGIQSLQSRLRVAGDGRPRFYVFRDALLSRDPGMEEAALPQGLVEEIGGYVWDVKPGIKGLPERPVKLNDHSCDMARYAVAHLDLVGEASLHNPAQPSGKSTRLGNRYGANVDSKYGQYLPKVK